MNTWKAVSAVVALNVLAGCVGIHSFSPPGGIPGTVVEIRGRGFESIPSNNTVRIGGSPARVIDGDATKLRVVALRDVATGLVEVQTSTDLLQSSVDFRREGTTESATPERDADAELFSGTHIQPDRKFDLARQGLGQKVLVILARPSDIDPDDPVHNPPGKTARERVQDSLTDPASSVNTYFSQASFNKISCAFTLTPDWVPLSQIRDFYCWQQDDIDRAQAAVDAAQAELDALNLDPSASAADIQAAEDKIAAKISAKQGAQNAQATLQQADFIWAEALLGAKAALPNFDDFTDHLLIVAGPFLRGQCCWTGTGFHAESSNPALPIGPFDIDFPANRGGTYVAQGAHPGRITHEFSHFFASGDLYAEGYADGSFVEGSAAAFDLMGNHDPFPLYSGYNMDIKLDYFTEGGGGNVASLQWNSVPDFDQSFDVVAHTKTEDATGDGTVHLVTLKVTDGLYYFVEVRQQPDPSAGAAQDYLFDKNIPLDPSNPAWKGGVIISKAVENNNQSNNNERAVQLVPPQRMMQTGDVFTDPARTIRISVTDRPQDRPAKYRVRVEWGHLPSADPNGQYDLRITPWGAPPWETVDIWANSIKNDETSPAKVIYQNHEPGDDTKPIGNGDPPWVGHDNTLFARVQNQGAQPTPESVRVTFYVNTPPGVGDDGTWAPFDTVDIGVLNAGEVREVQANRKWRPAVGEHTCVKVLIEPMNGEVTFDNNQAQENFSEFQTGSSSPYRPVEFDVVARNPYTVPVVMDMRTRDIPADWFVAIDHGSVWLLPNQQKKVHVVAWTDRIPDWIVKDKPRPNGPRKAMISIEGWCSRWGDQFFPVGGVTAFTHAVRDVRLSMEPRTKQVERKRPATLVIGTLPPTSPVPIALHITDPAGKLHVETTAVDPSGRVVYTTRFTFDQPGTYAVQAFTLGGGIAGETESPKVNLVVP